MTKEMVIRAADEPEPARPDPNPMALIQLALQQNADVDKLTKLFELQERWEAREAKKAFDNALAAFKENPPSIDKNKQVEYETAKGKTSYRHATIDNVCDKIGPALSAHGLSYRWKTENLESGVIKVTCILTHRLGHCEQTSLQAIGDQSGGKNAIQAIGSTLTYLERYSLLAACGIAVQNADDDGRAADQDGPISEAQVKEVAEALNKAKADWDKFLAFFRCGDLTDLKRSQLPKAMEMIKRKGGGK